MNVAIPDYEPAMRKAVGKFWDLRNRQSEAQGERGVTDAGTRGAVTGGKHLAPVENLIGEVLNDAGISWSDIYNGRTATLPGYFRELKNWDVVVVENDVLVAVIELKSQVGSFGNNLNNRIEEAVGQTVEFWKAVDKQIIPGLRPWFGYLMIVESSAKSQKTVASGGSLFPPDTDFRGMSYIDRYAEAFKRLHTERLLDAVGFAVSARDTDEVEYPSAAFSFQHFATALHNRVREVRSLHKHVK